MASNCRPVYTCQPKRIGRSLYDFTCGNQTTTKRREIKCKDYLSHRMNPSSLMVGTVCCGFICKPIIREYNQNLKIKDWPPKIIKSEFLKFQCKQQRYSFYRCPTWPYLIVDTIDNEKRFQVNPTRLALQSNRLIFSYLAACGIAAEEINWIIRWKRKECITLTNHGCVCSAFLYMSMWRMSTSMPSSLMHIQTARQGGDAAM